MEVVVSSALSGSLFKRHLYQVKENEAGITIDTWLRNESSKPVSGPISDRWTRFNSSGRFGSIEWADSVDPSHKAGYAYAWLPDENGKVAPRNSTLNPGDEIKIRRFVAVGQISGHALGVVAAKLGKTGRLKLNLTGTDKKPVSTASVDFRLEESTVRGYPDEDGKIEIQLPVGSWKMSCADIGRETRVSLEIKDGQTVEHFDERPIGDTVFSQKGGRIDDPLQGSVHWVGRNAEPQTRSGRSGAREQGPSTIPKKESFPWLLTRASTG